MGSKAGDSSVPVDGFKATKGGIAIPITQGLGASQVLVAHAIQLAQCPE